MREPGSGREERAGVGPIAVRHPGSPDIYRAEENSFSVLPFQVG